MKHLLLTFIILATSSSAMAACYGTKTFYTCNESNGNNYTVQKVGSTTYLNGNNALTGSVWSQTDMVIGSTTYTTGITNGRSWNKTTMIVGGTTYITGTDANGNSISSTCDSFGCF